MKQMHAVPGCQVERVARTGTGEVTMIVRSSRSGALCPACRTSSSAPHSTYVRRPADLPSLGRTVRLELQVRRFYCRNSSCHRRTFAERLPGLLDVRARRTRRLAAAQTAVAVEVGGEAGARLLERLAMPTSPDTLVRLIRCSPLPRVGTPSALGVDDWAIRKRQSYGTILVDLEAHRVVDLLPDRTASSLAAWLRRRKHISVITRDRSTEYTRGITTGAPEAIQVADRWHLLVNARDMSERWLTTVHGRLRPLRPLRPLEPVARWPGGSASSADPGAEDSGSGEVPPVSRAGAFPRTRAETAASVASRALWRARYEEVRRRHAAGETLLAIGRAMGLARGTVRKFAQAESFPAHAKHPPQPSILDPYLAHLARRHSDGCENAMQLWREIRTLGYPGTARQVHRWLQERRREPAAFQSPERRREAAERIARRHESRATAHPASVPALPSPTQLAWLVTREPDDLTEDERAVIARVEQDADAARVISLVRRFVAMVRDSKSATRIALAAFDAWLADARACGIRAVETFARGLEQDGAAVRAALSTPWSNGQTEGQITKLKLLKRQMYGRANFDLLRRRALLAA
ncbi:MAG TPA: ISL3 family transposase [Gemmatimonadales bacterium]